MRSPTVSWQASLLDGDGPSLDDGFTTLRRVRLDGRAWVDHAPDWLHGATALFDRLLAQVRWSHRDRPMYGQLVPEPRMHGRWPTSLHPEIRDGIARLLTERYDRPLEKIALNLYRDGRDSVAWHGDRVARDLPEAIVATVSLGSQRRFLLRPKGGGQSVRIEPGPGDLIVMGGSCQRDWEHSVPKVASAGARVSITVRHGYT